MPSDTLPEPGHRLLLACDYALINPLQVDVSTWEDLPTCPVVPRGYEDQPELFPRLLQLSALDQATRVGLLDRAQTWVAEEDTPWFSALLVAPVSIDRLRHHLVRLMVLRLPDGSDGLLRYHDPRVVRHMDWWLDDMQRDAWLGPIERWIWRDPDRTWHQTSRVGATDGPLRLTDPQLAILQRMGEINLLLAKLAQTSPELTTAPDAARQVDAALAAAWQNHHLAQRKERLLFAEQSLRYGPDIHRHPDLAKRLARARQGDETYVGACADLLADDMQRMVQDLHIHKERP